MQHFTSICCDYCRNGESYCSSVFVVSQSPVTSVVLPGVILVHWVSSFGECSCRIYAALYTSAGILERSRWTEEAFQSRDDFPVLFQVERLQRLDSEQQRIMPSQQRDSAGCRPPGKRSRRSRAKLARKKVQARV